MSTPEKAPLPPQTSAPGATGGEGAPRPIPRAAPRPASASAPNLNEGPPQSPSTIPIAPVMPLKPAVAPVTTPPVATSFGPAPSAPPAASPAATTSPPNASRVSVPLGGDDFSATNVAELVAPARPSVVQLNGPSQPGFSLGGTALMDPDPELQAAIAAVKGLPRMTDPEVSLDIPPPSDVKPPDARPAGAADPYIGTTFDHRYKIEALLGEGGMGFVYRARHKVIDKKVAVKVLRADLAKDREILDRFLQEAKAASSIGNPHIVDISDFGDLPDGSTYFVMEYLDGRSLSQIVDSGQRMPVSRICHVALQIADGLAAAHARGIVHRDLKPDNIFIIQRGADQDFVKILDFGIAKVSGGSNTKLTKAGAVFGTPHYMSPEQAAGAPIDHRTDIYSLGVMLYEMVSGQLPFNADNFMGILTQHMYKAPVPIRALVPVPDCPPSLEAVILKCLSKKPEQRYQSMEELAVDLAAMRDGRVPSAVAEMMARSGGFNVPVDYFKQPAAMVPATPKPQQRGPRYVLFGSLGVAALLVTGILVYGATSTGTPQGAQPAQTTAATTPPAPQTAAPTATVAAKPAAKKATLALSATPTSAVATYEQKTLKLPAILEFEENKPIKVEIAAKDYEKATVVLSVKDGKRVVEVQSEGREPETATLDEGDTGKTVELKKPSKAVKPVIGSGVKATSKSGTGPKKSGDLVDPWAKP